MSPILGIWASQNYSRYSLPTSFESIATTTVGSGGSSSVTFSSIPSTYTHLQLRIMARTSTNVDYSGWIQVGNGSADSGSNYSWHAIRGSGSSVGTLAYASQTEMFMWSSGTQSNDMCSVAIIDLLDYANTNKYKTVRGLGGGDYNGGGYVNLFSGAWLSTSAINTIKISNNGSTSTWGQYSHFALYGIKGGNS